MRLTSLLFSSILLLTSFVTKAQDGEKLFKQNCASCHRVDDKTVVGPGLQGVYDRVPSEEWMIEWIKNPQAMIANGDAYANQVYNEFNQQQMTAFSYLEDEQIMAILEYIKNPPVPEKKPDETTAGGEGGGAGGTAGSGTLSDATLTYILLGIAVLLLVLISVLGGVRRSLTVLIGQRTGDEVPEEPGFFGSIGQWMNAHRGWTAVFGLVLVLSFLRWGVIFLMDEVGVYQGYQPEQPINFSHKIHAGQNGINCVYCHTSAEKGKTSGIPSLNVCMNCHTYVQEGPSGTEEIAKIYAALDYNPDTKEYGSNPKPVKWVRVHNLPDLAYFNHSQHVVVGKIECETCHGKMEEVGVAKQHSPLTMGWCIDCHRETSVQVADNGYYEELHERTPGWHDGDPITVERIGGLECAKCHY